MLEVALAHAIGHPAAVMVHASHASTTLTAVMGAWRLHTVALFADVQELVLQVVNVMVLKSETAPAAIGK